jgi:hypothetical protein
MKRNTTSLSNYRLATCDMGQLVPVQCQEVLPGDTMKLDSSALIRLSPMQAPVMHPVTVRLHHWFVPNRLIWDNWEDFITGGPDNDNTDTVPTITTTGAVGQELLDYLGIPVDTAGIEVNELPVRAYNLIYNEFYRDQDLQTERTEDDPTVAHVSWRKDYFTASRPWQQKGANLTLPIGDTAPITQSHYTSSTVSSVTYDADGDAFSNTTATESGRLIADLSEATGVSAVDFREFFALQRYAEARSRYGSRYTEYLSYLGINAGDSRLNRPEYLGGGKSTIQISEVLQTAEGTSTEVGTMRGHGISAMKTKPTRKFFKEHGHVITLMSVVPKSIYQDGVARNFLRQDKEDYYQKELQSIGQQKVYQGEVYAKTPANNKNTFGYQDRYSEYLTCPSGVSGEFRDELDYWHLGRKFATDPALNESFIKCDPSVRIFSDQTDSHKLWCMINNKVVARRMVKKTSIGRLM